MTIETPEDMFKSWLEIDNQIKQLLSKSDPSSVTKVSKKALMDKNSITREKFADLVMSMHNFGYEVVELAKKQDDSKNNIKSYLKELLPEAIKEAMIPMKPVTSDDIKELLPAVVKDAIPAAMRSDTKVNMQKIEVVKHRLLVENKDDGGKFTDRAWTTVVKSGNVKKKLKDVQVSNSYLSNSGIGTFTFATAEARDKAANVLGADYKVTSQSAVPKLLAPKIKIIGVCSDVFNDSKDDIICQIREKNPDIDQLIVNEDDFKIIFMKKEENFIVIKTTGRIRELIIEMGNKIYLGLQILNVHDHIHLIQCYHCQEFGHYSGSDFCKQKKGRGACFYCASSEHKSSDCRDKRNISRHRCINCVRDKRSSTNHKSADPLCPLVIRETLRMYSRIDGVDPESKNMYIRMTERLRQRRNQA